MKLKYDPLGSSAKIINLGVFFSAFFSIGNIYPKFHSCLKGILVDAIGRCTVTRILTPFAKN